MMRPKLKRTQEVWKYLNLSILLILSGVQTLKRALWA